jgi:hypothetical protein
MKNENYENFPVPNRRICAASIINHRLLEDPENQARRALVEVNARRAVAPTGIVDVTVVVHIVTRNPAQITDAQVHSQIDVLNEDFQARNADIGKVPGAFSGVVGNPEIRFSLATADPLGNATNGITRTSTNVARFSTADDGVKSAATGGHDPWDTSRFLNLWVAVIFDPMLGNLLGYAQFPGLTPATDGVVITPSAFGRGGTASAPFDLGRTASHEFGHYFDLRHIWGDRVGCVGDDLVADTPKHEKPNYDKPTFPQVTCSNAPNGEMFMNYMDYVDDDTMMMFTKGQIARMRAALAGPRSGLIPDEAEAASQFKAAARVAQF